MFSAHIVYGLGIVVSLINIVLWSQIIRAQIGQYNGDNKNNQYKTILLIFGVVSLAANFVPIWFDIYRILNDTNPTNIFYAYVMSSYLYRTATALMFYLLYKY